jgi:hypothetical protein
MKKLSVRRRKWFIHRQKYVLKRRIRQLPELVTVTQPNAPMWTARAARRKYCFPELLCFNDNGSETVAALADIRRNLHLPMRGTRRGRDVSKHRNARVRQAGRFRSFEVVKGISPAAALVLAAEFERGSALRGVVPAIYNFEKWNPSVLDTLWDIGFFDIVGFPTGLEQPMLDDYYCVLPMVSGDTADSEAVSDLIGKLTALYPQGEGDVAASDVLVHLYGAMIEAVVNVCRHAYPCSGRYQYKPVGRWWMTGAVDRRERWTTAVIFDQGVTIPVSLPDWQNYAGWRTRIATRLGLAPSPDDHRSDGEVIATAVEEAVSSTGQPYRGHGLAQMRDFVNCCRGGYLRIMSRCGEVIFYPGGDKKVKTHEASIGGTLIEWNVLL